MARVIEIECSGDPNEKLAQARKKARENGITIEDGSIHGMGFEGTYEIRRSTITVTMTKKPFIIGWDRVESEIRKFLR